MRVVIPAVFMAMPDSMKKGAARRVNELAVAVRRWGRASKTSPLAQR